jgi:hypothetical protein
MVELCLNWFESKLQKIEKKRENQKKIKEQKKIGR